MSEPFWEKKYTKASVKKINFPHMWWIFPWGKIIFHTLSLIKGCEEKKSKCVENGHSKLEITRKIKKKNAYPPVAIVFGGTALKFIKGIWSRGIPLGTISIDLMLFNYFSLRFVIGLNYRLTNITWVIIKRLSDYLSKWPFATATAKSRSGQDPDLT